MNRSDLRSRAPHPRIRRIAGGAAALILLAAAGCGAAPGDAAGHIPGAAGADHPGSAADPHATGHAHPAPLAAAEHSDLSIYHLESEWWDQHGEHRRLGSLAGRVQVVSMVYTHCAYTCPRILAEMKRIESETAGAGPGVGFVLVSIDPERDTPGRLAHFAGSTRLDPDRWTLLGGDDGDVLELSMLLGIRYRREGESEFSHSNTMLVLDPAGEIVFRQPGLGEDLGPLLRAVRAAAPAASTPAG
jgi:protein SCO1